MAERAAALSDFYQIADADEKAVVKNVRTYLETHVAPIINKYSSDDAFPFERLETRHLESASTGAGVKPSRSSTGCEPSAVRVGFLLCGRTFRAAWQPR
jgi:hypothetical protein